MQLGIDFRVCHPGLMQSPAAFPSDSVISIAASVDLFRGAIERLCDFGFRVSPGDRVSRYLETLVRLGSADIEALAPLEMSALTNALNEASILVDVASLPDAYLSATRDRVYILNGGREVEDDAHDPARDAAVELQVAARCNFLGTLGASPSVRGDVNVLTTYGERPVEVKRISSTKRIRQRAKDGVKQLAPSQVSDLPGVVLQCQYSKQETFRLD